MSTAPTAVALSCRLCHTTHNGTLFYQDKFRPYYQCQQCSMVFVPDAYLLSPEAEQHEYSLHENNIDDVGYRKFLSRAVDPLLSDPFLSHHPLTSSEKNSEPSNSANESQTSSNCPNSDVVLGLDFGCGPVPALATMVREQRPHWHVTVYDKYFAPNEEALFPLCNNQQEGKKENDDHHHMEEGRYHFITATEVIEHLADPGMELLRLWSLLKPDNGLLVLMTKRVIDLDRFRNWHYKNDRTHISFFHLKSFEYLVRTDAWLGREGRGVEAELMVLGNDVVAIRKKRKETN